MPEPTIHELMSAVRAHPDFVFGTIFTRGDFPRGVVPEDFNDSLIEDLLTEHGNEYIASS